MSYILVKEEKPLHGQAVYFFSKEFGVLAGNYFEEHNKDLWSSDGTYIDAPVTHWMPRLASAPVRLPPAP